LIKSGNFCAKGRGFENDGIVQISEDRFRIEDAFRNASRLESFLADSSDPIGPIETKAFFEAAVNGGSVFKLLLSSFSFAGKFCSEQT
jgi:hypothetical protein